MNNNEIFKHRKQSEFYDKYPELFPNAEPRCGFYCDYGWWPLIDTLCSDILSEIKNTDGQPPSVIIDQIKEKFGSLRFYVDYKNTDKNLIDRVQSLITKAEEKSKEICEICGASGGQNVYNGWMKIHCKQCEESKNI